MSALYRFGSALFLGGFRALGVDLRVTGHEHIPSTGPVVLASNHIGYLDFAFVMLGPPAPRREVRFLARDDFFRNPVTGFLLRRLGQIPVDVHGDAMQAAAAAQAVLEDGEVVGLHPEGTISPSFVPRRAKSGVVRLADSVEAPIVPVALWGSQRLLTKGRPARPTRGAEHHEREVEVADVVARQHDGPGGRDVLIAGHPQVDAQRSEAREEQRGAEPVQRGHGGSSCVVAVVRDGGGRRPKAG